jgi:hypothetical protein
VLLALCLALDKKAPIESRNRISGKHSSAIVEIGTIWLLGTLGIALCFNKFLCFGFIFQDDFPNPVVPKPDKPDKL